jgi:hypothetical protein
VPGGRSARLGLNRVDGPDRNLQPHRGHHWACQGGRGHIRRYRRRATFTRLHGVRHLFAAYDRRADKLYGHVRKRRRRGEFVEFLR